MERFEEIRSLFDIHDNSFDIAEEIISRREKYLGKQLPEILRQYYLQLGNNEQINQSQDNLVLPTELEIYDDGFAIIYYENQVVWQAGIKASDFYLENPPVYFSYDQENWEFEVGKLRDFLVFQAFLQSLFALPFNANSVDVGNEKEKFIRDNWKELNIPQILQGTEFFQKSENEILSIMKSEDEVSVFVAAKNEEHFNELLEKLDIDWDYNSLEDE